MNVALAGPLVQQLAQLMTQGIVLSQDTLGSPWFGVLAAFVAINTVMYLALAVAKILPKVYPRDWLPRSYARAQERGIYPDGPGRPG